MEILNNSIGLFISTWSGHGCLKQYVYFDHDAICVHNPSMLSILTGWHSSCDLENNYVFNTTMVRYFLSGTLYSYIPKVQLPKVKLKVWLKQNVKITINRMLWITL